MELPAAFLLRMEQQLGPEQFAAYLSAMEKPPQRSGRVNTLKADPARFSEVTGIPLSEEDAFFLPEAVTPGTDVFHAAGLYYMQESSARFPVTLFSIRPGMTVLDICAAPGGKSGQLAARLNGTGLLVSNEVIPSRARILESNLERLGVTNAVTVNAEAEALVSSSGPIFDAVLVDAPCAGEGMFRKDPGAVRDWSEEHVKSCAARQRKLLLSAQKALKPGGELVYSTCSFSPEENALTVRDLLEHCPDLTLIREQTLYPHTSSGEGQYAALLVRDGNRPETPLIPMKEHAPREWDGFREQVALPEGYAVCGLKDGRITALPPLPSPELFKGLHVLRAGILLGDCIKERFEPAHALAMAGRESPLLQKQELTRQEAERYLRGETLPASISSWCTVTCSGFALGLGKGAGGILKNHLPKGLRLH